MNTPVKITLPLSKSIALRVMALNSVAEALGMAPAVIPQLPDAEDVEGMRRALDALRVSRLNARHVDINIGEGGAPIRFFTALAASIAGADVTVSGSGRLNRRPIRQLVEVLRQAGADIEYAAQEGFPPLHIRGRNLAPGVLTIDPGVSSQFISALMLVSPLWGDGLRLRLDGGKGVSTSYLKMTASVLKRFGIVSSLTSEEIAVPKQPMRAPALFAIESDWSAASYFYELNRLRPENPVGFVNLTPGEQSLQGDSVVEALFASPDMEIDLNDTPDLAPALCVGFCLTERRFTFINVGHLRHKECDRLDALATEMRKLGYLIEVGEDTLAWQGARCGAEPVPRIATYKDHRMAMAFAPAVLRYPDIVIENPAVVGKSFPKYWDEMAKAGIKPEIRPDKI